MEKNAILSEEVIKERIVSLRNQFNKIEKLLPKPIAKAFIMLILVTLKEVTQKEFKNATAHLLETERMFLRLEQLEKAKKKGITPSSMLKELALTHAQNN